MSTLRAQTARGIGAQGAETAGRIFGREGPNCGLKKEQNWRPWVGRKGSSCQTLEAGDSVMQEWLWVTLGEPF